MISIEQIWKWLKEVSDPEIPVLSVVDLGVIRSVRYDDEVAIITITPTYSGCPAMKVIEEDISIQLRSKGVKSVAVELTLAPAWTTDWITEEGKERLREYGIAPPVDEVDKSVLFANPPVVPCPLCGSKNTKMISQFGSTACKLITNVRTA